MINVICYLQHLGSCKRVLGLNLLVSWVLCEPVDVANSGGVHAGEILVNHALRAYA